MTAGAGNTFALVPGAITTPGGITAIAFTISPTLFTLPRGKMVIGIDVVAKADSKLQPLIKRIDNPHNQIVPQAIDTIYNPRLSHAAVARGAGTRAVLAPLTRIPNKPDQPATYSAIVSGESKTSGNFLVGFYLPGDVDGNGVVDQADVNAVRALLGAKAGDKNYNFDADVNRDGRIGPIDVAYTRQNLGVKTTVSPLVKVNLDPASDSGALDRITNIRDVHFSGQGTPGATIKFDEVSHKSPEASTTADAAGNYSIIVTLGDGVNTFKVTSIDSFGQTISGQIAPVTYTTHPPIAPAVTRPS